MRLFTILLTLLIYNAIGNCSSLLRGLREYGPPSQYYQSEFYPTTISDPKIENIITLLGTKKWESVGEYLIELKKQYPQYFDSYTLIKQSESLQESSAQFPRAIVFGQTAKLLMTFNGNSQHRGFSTLEFISQKETGYEFREIYKTSEGLQISEANPSKCMVCHSTGLTPIWKGYDRWPGAYGEFDDQLLDREGYSSYQEIRNQHSRYNLLKKSDKVKSFPFSPVSPRSNADYSVSKFRPNLRLTKLLSRNHSEVMGNRILRADSLNNLFALRYLLAQLDCTDYQLPNVLRIMSQTPKEEIHFFRNFGISAAFYSFQSEINQFKFFNGVYNQETLLFEKVLLALQEIDPTLVGSRWFDYRFETPYTREGEADLYRDLLGEDGSIDPYNLDFTEILCRQLERKMKPEQYIEKSKELSKRSPLKEGLTFQMCLSCHSKTHPHWEKLNLLDRGALLLFKEKIKDRIESNMPPQRQLNAVEKEELNRWLDSLVRRANLATNSN